MRLSYTSWPLFDEYGLKWVLPKSDRVCHPERAPLRFAEAMVTRSLSPRQGDRPLQVLRWLANSDFIDLSPKTIDSGLFEMV
jgi:hypothetical protein